MFNLNDKLCSIHTGTILHGDVPTGDVMVADTWRDYLESNNEVSVYTDVNVVMGLIPNNAVLNIRARRQAQSRRVSVA